MSVIVGPRARASAARGFVFAEVPPLRLNRLDQAARRGGEWTGAR
jgi:hypothetical protein